MPSSSKHSSLALCLAFGLGGVIGIIASAEIEPSREFRDWFERSILADGTPNGTVDRDDSGVLNTNVFYHELKVVIDKIEDFESGDFLPAFLEIRGGGKLVNVVLLDTSSRASISAELNVDRLHDGTVNPGAKLPFAGQSGRFNYLLHVEAEPRYQNRYSEEESRDVTGNLLETREETDVRAHTEFQTSINLGYQFDSSMLQLNGLYGESSPPSDT